MKFTKMQGAGNDYVYINCLAENLPEEARSALAVKLSNRNFGVGSDGLICICPSDKADFRMDMYNADGSRSGMCGNGIRCVGKYVHDRGLTDKTELVIETGAGLRRLSLALADGQVSAVTVDMGAPIFTPAEIPVLAEGESFIAQTVEVDGRAWKVTALSVGNPHAVVFVEEDVETLDLLRLGPLFENHPLFPQRVNTEFVNVLPDGRLKMLVWERGSGETLACGTGATATLVAATLCGYADGEADVLLRGGTLHIRWDRESNTVYMTGPAAFVFDGELCQ